MKNDEFADCHAHTRKVQQGVGNEENREIDEFSDDKTVEKKVTYADIVRIKSNVENTNADKPVDERQRNAIDALILRNKSK